MATQDVSMANCTNTPPGATRSRHAHTQPKEVCVFSGEKIDSAIDHVPEVTRACDVDNADSVRQNVSVSEDTQPDIGHIEKTDRNGSKTAYIVKHEAENDKSNPVRRDTNTNEKDAVVSKVHAMRTQQGSASISPPHESMAHTTLLRQLDKRICVFKRAHAEVIEYVKTSACPEAERIRESDRLSWDWLPSLGLFSAQTASDRKRFICGHILKAGAVVEGVVQHATEHKLELKLSSILLVICDREMTHAKDTRDGGHMVGRRPLRINDLDSLEIQAEIYSHRQRDSRLSMDEREEEELFLDCRRHDTVRGVMRSVQQPISDTPLVLLRMSYDPDDRRRDQVRLGRVRNEEKNFNVEFEKTASFNAHCEKIYDFHNPKLTEEMRSVLGLDTTCDTLMVSTGRHVYSNDTCVEAIRSKQNQLLAHNFVAKAVTVLKAGGNASKCHQYLNEALSVCPKYIEALVARGAVNIQTNKLDAAIIDLQEAVNQNVEHKNAVKYLSAALVKRAKGLMDMHRSRASDKSSGMNEKALEKAMNDLQRAHKLCPDNQETFDLLKLAQHTKFEAIQQEANRKKALLKAAMSALEEEATASRERKRARRSDNDIPKTKGKRRKRSKSRSSHRKHRKGRSAKRSSSGSSGEDWDSSSTSDSSDNSDSDSDSDDASRDHGRRKKRKKRKEQHKKSRRR